jgi:hypothetical protein
LFSTSCRSFGLAFGPFFSVLLLIFIGSICYRSLLNLAIGVSCTGMMETQHTSLLMATICKLANLCGLTLSLCKLILVSVCRTNTASSARAVSTLSGGVRIHSGSQSGSAERAARHDSGIRRGAVRCGKNVRPSSRAYVHDNARTEVWLGHARCLRPGHGELRIAALAAYSC